MNCKKVTFVLHVKELQMLKDKLISTCRLSDGIIFVGGFGLSRNSFVLRVRWTHVFTLILTFSTVYPEPLSIGAIRLESVFFIFLTNEEYYFQQIVVLHYSNDVFIIENKINKQ